MDINQTWTTSLRQILPGSLGFFGRLDPITLHPWSLRASFCPWKMVLGIFSRVHLGVKKLQGGSKFASLFLGLFFLYMVETPSSHSSMFFFLGKQSHNRKTPFFKALVLIFRVGEGIFVNQLIRIKTPTDQSSLCYLGTALSEWCESSCSSSWSEFFIWVSWCFMIFHSCVSQLLNADLILSKITITIFGRFSSRCLG